VLFPGIAMLVQPVIAVPAVFFTVSVADVYVLEVVKTNERHPWIASTDEHAIRGTTTPASKMAVGAGTAQLPGVPE
jgi:hypothetical protein